MTARYIAKRPNDEATLVEHMKQIAGKHPRFGYRRVHQMVCRSWACGTGTSTSTSTSTEAAKINHKRVYRLWKHAGLAVKRRIKKRRAVGAKQERTVAAAGPNQVWTVDFVQDQIVTGRKIRMLSVTDEFTRESLAIEVGLSLTAENVTRVLGRLLAQREAPEHLRSDNGPEFVALALRGFLHRSGVKTAFIAPGSPWQNGFAESFHSRFRDEFLNQEVFLSVTDAQVRVEAWRRWSQCPASSQQFRLPNARRVRRALESLESNWKASGQKVAKTNSPVGT